MALRKRSEWWAMTAVVGRSLGRRAMLELVARDFRLCGVIRGEVSVFGLDGGLLLFRFGEPEEQDYVLRWPWVVAGQALALEPWRPGFFPVEGAITSALVWIHLPRLPVKYWEEALGEVVQPAGKFISVDNYMRDMRRLGFARVCMRISLNRPLRSGVLVKGPQGPFWQHFVFEGPEGVCLSYGLFHPPKKCYQVGRGAVVIGL